MVKPPNPVNDPDVPGPLPHLDPLGCLERIAYLLETVHAPTYRVRAFRAAAEAVRKAGQAQIEALSASGRLTTLRAVGETTAQVITEAVRGLRPEYLLRLEEQAAIAAAQEVDPAVTTLVASLRGDLHSHSDWSDGGSPIEVMAAAARALGHDYLALTDHSPRLTVAHGLNEERLTLQLAVVAEVNERLAPFRLLTGIEVDILENGQLDQSEELLDRLDIVVASVHSKLRMPGEAMTERLVRAVSNPQVDILGHCTGRIVVGKGRPPSEFVPEVVFDACARHGTAVEINSRPERLDPPDDLLSIAVSHGCTFSIDSDAHAPGQLEWLANGARKAVTAGVAVDNIITTWDWTRLKAWTEERPSSLTKSQ